MGSIGKADIDKGTLMWEGAMHLLSIRMIEAVAWDPMVPGQTGGQGDDRLE